MRIFLTDSNAPFSLVEEDLSTFMVWSNEDKSWETRVCMRIFSSFMLWSNENESWYPWEFFSTLINICTIYLSHLKGDERRWELAVKRERELQLLSTLPTVYNFHSISSSFHVIISQQTVVELSYVSYNQAYLRTVHFSWKMSFPKLAILITYGTNRISHWNMRK